MKSKVSIDMFIFRKILFSFVVTGVLVGCGAGKNKTNVELVTAMMDQESVKSQDWDASKPGERAMMVPPVNTVPRGFKPYKYHLQVDLAEKELVNPLAKDFSAEVLATGKVKFEIYCGLCHGVKGDGQGQIAQFMAVKPPSFLQDRLKKKKDGRFYHVIRDGYGVMGSYSRQILKDSDRWSVVNYIRTLQK